MTAVAFSNTFGLILWTLGPFNVLISAQRLYLFTWCVRLSRLLVGFRTLKIIALSFIHLLCAVDSNVHTNMYHY